MNCPTCGSAMTKMNSKWSCLNCGHVVQQNSQNPPVLSATEPNKGDTGINTTDQVDEATSTNDAQQQSSPEANNESVATSDTAADKIPKNSPKNRLGLILAGLVMSVLWGVIAVRIEDKDPLECGSGLGALGCSFIEGYFILFVSLIISATVAYFILRIFHIRRALLITTSVALLGPAFYFFSGGFAALLGFFSLIITPVLFITSFLLMHAIFNERSSSLRKSIPIALAVIVAASVILPVAGYKIDSYQAQKEEEAPYKSLDFEVYLPSYIPEGFEYDAGYANRLDETKQFFKASYEEKKVVPPGLYYITSFKKPVYFNPPVNCGGEEPENEPGSTHPCQELGKTDQGETVYLVFVEEFNAVAYIQKGNTVTTLSTVGRRMISKEEVLRILSSLRPASTEELLKIRTI